MPQFLFTVSDEKGQRKSGVITANSDVSAIKKLTEKEFMVLSISPYKNRQIDFLRLLGFKKIKLRGEELLAFSQELGVMLNAGISLRSAINVLTTDSKHPAFKHIVTEIGTGLDAGGSLSDLLQKFPDAFSTMYVSMVKAGEKGGKLPTILLRLANYIQRAENLKKKIQAALYYPAMVLAFGIIILSLITIFGVPHLKNIYDSLSAELPLPTRMFLATGSFVSNNWLVLLLFLALVSLLIKRFLATEGGQLLLDNFKLYVAVIGSLYRRLIVARFAISLSTLYSSGISIVQGMELVATALGNRVMEKVVLKAVKKIYEGESFIEPLRRSKMFPEMAISMIAAGEESGSLDMMLDELASYYEEQVNIALQALSALFEPVAVIIVGFGLGIAILSLALPFMQIGSIVK